MEEAAERIAAIAGNDRQALVVARCEGRVCGLVALDFMYYLPLGTTTCRITALVVTSHAQGRGLGRQLLHEAELRARAAGAARLELSSGSQRTDRSEEHTSELQSLMRISYAVFCLKKKKTKTKDNTRQLTTQEENAN